MSAIDYLDFNAQMRRSKYERRRLIKKRNAAKQNVNQSFKKRNAAFVMKNNNLVSKKNMNK